MSGNSNGPQSERLPSRRSNSEVIIACLHQIIYLQNTVLRFRVEIESETTFRAIERILFLLRKMLDTKPNTCPDDHVLIKYFTASSEKRVEVKRIAHETELRRRTK